MQRVSALFLALLMLSSHLSLSLNVHLCMGEAAEHSVSLGHEHLQCGMDLMHRHCEKATTSAPCSQNIQSLSCCENHNFSIVTDSYATSKTPLLLAPWAALPRLSLGLPAFRQIAQTPKSYPFPPPPLLAQQRRALLQCFII